ncbi:MAG: cell division protein CrgA [Candidatus Nanopelagicales bacterium]
MPESKGRGKPKPPSAVDENRKVAPAASPRWLAPVMVTLFLLGLLWIVVYYLAPSLPLMADLGNWNMLIGFGMIMGGFVLSTRWR